MLGHFHLWSIRTCVSLNNQSYSRQSLNRLQYVKIGASVSDSGRKCAEVGI